MQKEHKRKIKQKQKTLVLITVLLAKPEQLWGTAVRLLIKTVQMKK